MGSVIWIGTTFSMRPAAETLTQSRQEKGPLKESAYQGVFFGLGRVSSASTGTAPSVIAAGFKFSYQAASVPHSSGGGIGVDGVTGLNVICSIFGARTGTAGATRSPARVSPGCPAGR